MEIRNNPSSFNEIDNIRKLFKLWHNYSGAGTGEVRELLKKARCLGALCLTREIKTLPRTIDKLVHLRYLDLSHIYELEFLPATVCKLNNLQTLKLIECWSLKELPTKLSKLEKLRCLDIEGCGRLALMPPRMGKLTCLEKLPQFVVSHSQEGQANRGRLQDLEALTNVGGSLKISVRGFSTHQVTEGAKCVRGMIHLIDIHIEISCLFNNDAGSTLLLECLQPNCNLIHFNLYGYGGVAFPNWESIEDLEASLPKLVEFWLGDCANLLNLPLLRQLHHLKTLNLISSNDLTLKFCNNENLKSFSIVEELFRSRLSSSLCSLQVKKWRYLKSLCGGGLEHLTALQTLHLSELYDLEELEDGNHSHLPWKFLTRLRDLKLQYLPKLVNLPQGIEHLAALQSLHVEACKSFEHSAECVSR
uniref:Disease resistance R13L4/SHOC-2-like LRR domain-containing protein n=1 Tax=Chenopodium quinoa TaxID=63459 RepID=A0A803MV57_CHEQI